MDGTSGTTTRFQRLVDCRFTSGGIPGIDIQRKGSSTRSTSRMTVTSREISESASVPSREVETVGAQSRGGVGKRNIRTMDIAIRVSPIGATEKIATNTGIDFKISGQTYSSS